MRRPDGSWNGMVGDLVEGRADVAVGVALSPDRDSSVDFTLQINEGGWVCVGVVGRRGEEGERWGKVR